MDVFRFLRIIPENLESKFLEVFSYSLLNLSEYETESFWNIVSYQDYTLQSTE